MNIISFIKDGHQMLPIEVELSLSPGLPKVQFTGMADMAIKESMTRLKTAFQNQQLIWPRRKQITINLKPAYIKKTSHGLDLAIACALLWQTKQFYPPDLKFYFIYGEVSLNGKVEAPEDWMQIEASPLLTGKVFHSFTDLYYVENLRDLKNPKLLKSKPLSHFIQKPILPKIKFSKNQALLLEIIASGEHSTLLAGEAGSGKTTLAHHLHYLISSPCEKEFKTSKRIAQFFGKNLSWRPFISPHHSTPPLSMIGGGFPPFLGEISKAHGGILFLDEYLEFQHMVQEALREPMEKGEIFISRKGEGVLFPARFILIAATNLCHCGSFIPGKQAPCSYSLRRCRAKLEKLSGPMLDRFDMLSLSTFWRGPLEVPIENIYKKITQAVQFRKKRKQQKPNGQLSLEELEKPIPAFILKNIMPSTAPSKRRYMAVLKVARTLADLQQREKISPQDIEQSTQFSLKSFNELKFLS